MSEIGIDKVRASRDGHQYHEAWLARRALGLLLPRDQLCGIAVEGLSVEDQDDVGDTAIEVADATFYFGKAASFEECSRLEITQFKYSIGRADADFRFADAKKTLKKWFPLALLWFGQTEAAMLFVVIMGTVGSVVIATSNGARSILTIYVRVARTMGSDGLDKWTRVILPASLPFPVTGMKQGWAFAWRSLMAAEIYVTILTGFGLGHLLHYGRELSAMDQVIGIMLIIVMIGFVSDKVLFAPWERFMHRRWGTGGTH
jgi:hypothetical protein